MLKTRVYFRAVCTTVAINMADIANGIRDNDSWWHYLNINQNILITKHLHSRLTTVQPCPIHNVLSESGYASVLYSHNWPRNAISLSLTHNAIALSLKHNHISLSLIHNILPRLTWHTNRSRYPWPTMLSRYHWNTIISRYPWSTTFCLALPDTLIGLAIPDPQCRLGTFSVSSSYL